MGLHRERRLERTTHRYVRPCRCKSDSSNRGGGEAEVRKRYRQRVCLCAVIRYFRDTRHFVGPPRRPARAMMARKPSTGGGACSGPPRCHGKPSIAIVRRSTPGPATAPRAARDGTARRGRRRACRYRGRDPCVGVVRGQRAGGHGAMGIADCRRAENHGVCAVGDATMNPHRSTTETKPEARQQPRCCDTESWRKVGVPHCFWYPHRAGCAVVKQSERASSTGVTQAHGIPAWRLRHPPTGAPRQAEAPRAAPAEQAVR